jgi:hypothetical protein
MPPSSFTTSVTSLSWTHISSGLQKTGNGGGVCCADAFLKQAAITTALQKVNWKKVPLQ